MHKKHTLERLCMNKKPTNQQGGKSTQKVLEKNTTNCSLFILSNLEEQLFGWLVGWLVSWLVDPLSSSPPKKLLWLTSLLEEPSPPPPQSEHWCVRFSLVWLVVFGSYFFSPSPTSHPSFLLKEKTISLQGYSLRLGWQCVCVCVCAGSDRKGEKRKWQFWRRW